ncbi:MAG: chaperonin Cpn10 [Myxococcales bacterium]|nr:chaperonin Cpn10 [Myxococcales bacterium]
MAACALQRLEHGDPTAFTACRRAGRSQLSGMDIQPLHDRIVAKRLPYEEKTASGLFIPDTAKEKPMRAKVVAVGEGTRLADGKLLPLDVKPGDQVLIGPNTGSDIVINGEDHLVLHESEVLAVVH